MLAKVTTCPFQDPEHIANCLERGSEDLQIVSIELLNNIRNAGLASMANQIEDNHLASMNAAATELIRSIVCIYCDTNNQCHPA